MTKDKITSRQLKSSNASQDLSALISEVIPDKSALVFCATKKNCEETAKALCKEISPHHLTIHTQERLQLLEDLRNINGTSSGIFSQTLQLTIPMGIAHHHAGLTSAERLLLEESFRNKIINVLCCTSTLAAGVNLPASRVIFKTPYVGRDFLTKSKYAQMSGRAGRAGLDTMGESYLLLNQKRSGEHEKGFALMCGSLETVRSVLLSDYDGVHYHGVIKLLLECICTQLVTSVEQLPKCLDACFYVHCCNGDDDHALLQRAIHDSYQYLLQHQFIRQVQQSPPITTIVQHDEQDDEFTDDEDEQDEQLKDNTVQLSPTPLGLATFHSSFMANESNMLYDQLHSLQKNGIILQDSLHMCYMSCPLTNLIEPDWMLFMNMFNQLDPTRSLIAKMIGLDESILINKVMKRNCDADQELMARRFFNALILCDHIEERSLFDTCARYQVAGGAGVVQSLCESAAQFSSMVMLFCSRLKLTIMEEAFRRVSKRIGYGVKDDLLQLMNMDDMDRVSARVLVENGIQDAHALLTQFSSARQLYNKLKHVLGVTPIAASKILIQSARRCLQRESNRYKSMSDAIELII
ncbi:Helq [Acrasis kona]|uniref:Helq n=1 Tax=Acrasis kona TaxID=1008807 RepID=A0AAW2ZMB8_9EUKA